MFQRPQQLMKAITKAGHRAVFMEYGRYDGNIYVRDGVEICDCRSLLPKGNEPTILWTSHPPYYRFKETFYADLLVFDYIDEASEEFAIWNNNDLYEAMNQADVVTVVSQRLYDQVKMQFPEKTVLLLPNAADYEHFSNSKQLPCPIDMASIPHPVIGFMGSIATWIDTELIHQVAQLRPDWSIVLLGNDYVRVERIFANCPNVYFLGRKFYHELPPYVGQFAVGMVPFQVRDMTHSSSPIKMYEYLAAGVPVISTPIKESVNCPYVATGATATEWVNEIEQLLSISGDELQAFAQQESWLARIEQVEPVLTQLASDKETNHLLRLQTFPVTSPEYWDIRFFTDWENLNGREQTAFFAKLILDYLPEHIKTDVATNSHLLCDMGCALGDALPFYANAFPNTSLVGVDISTEAINRAKRTYPEHAFEIKSIESNTNEYDVIFCSNVLALFSDPIQVVKQLLNKVNHYLLILVPFQVTDISAENRFVFQPETFPVTIDNFQLTSLTEIDCTALPQSYCQSKQVLAIYQKR